MKIVKPSVELITHTPNPTELIELAGRVSYKSEGNAGPGTAEAFVERRLTPGDDEDDPPHESLLRHPMATLRIICDRGVSHEVVRHGIGVGLTQESTRFCNYSQDRFGGQIGVIEPPELNTAKRQSIWERACCVAEDAYRELLSDGYPAQLARAVLPTCLKTEIVFSGSFLAWLNFLRQRTAKKAQPQMREIADLIHAELKRVCPVVFEKLRRKSKRAERRDQILLDMAKTREASDCCGAPGGCVWCGCVGGHEKGCPTLLAREALGLPVDKEPEVLA